MEVKDFSHHMHLLSHDQGADILAFGQVDSITIASTDGAWQAARAFLDIHSDKYVLGYFSYELKDDIEALESKHPAFIEMPALVLFVPQVIYTWELGEIHCMARYDHDLDTRGIEEEILQLYTQPSAEAQGNRPSSSSMSKDAYMEKIKTLKQHIQQGDIYEVNFCQEFRLQPVDINPYAAFQDLSERTRAPYACHLRWGEKHLLCASPELFLEKHGHVVRSSPIKGTRRRGADPEEDDMLKEELKRDTKERAENIMITDLVRNDLSRIAKSGSVEVEELCEIYSYDTVHQMVSTIRAEVPEDVHAIDILKACFPMGSMTGAPKIRAMELIEEHEDFKRGIYSGSIGMFFPNGDFVLNVVIRSILYDKAELKASVAAGGAITALSDPEMEYDESLLKARAMMQVLGTAL